MLAACPHCDWSDVVGDEFLGQTAECPSCETDLLFKILKPQLQLKRKN